MWAIEEEEAEEEPDPEDAEREEAGEDEFVVEEEEEEAEDRVGNWMEVEMRSSEGEERKGWKGDDGEVAAEDESVEGMMGCREEREDEEDWTLTVCSEHERATAAAEEEADSMDGWSFCRLVLCCFLRLR